MSPHFLRARRGRRLPVPGWGEPALPQLLRAKVPLSWTRAGVSPPLVAVVGPPPAAQATPSCVRVASWHTGCEPPLWAHVGARAPRFRRTRGPPCPQHPRLEPALPAHAALREPPITARASVPGTGVLPSTRSVPQSRTMFPRLPRRVSPLAGPAPSTRHGGVPTRTTRALENPQTGPSSRPDILTCTHLPCAFNHAYTGPHHKPMRPQPFTQWFPLAGRAPSTAHTVVPTRRPCVFKHTDRDSHSWATHHHQLLTDGSSRHPQLHTKGSTPHGCVPSTSIRASPLVRSQLGTERSPLADPWAVCLQPHKQCLAITKTCTLNRSRSASHPRAMRPQPHMERSLLGCSAPSSTLGGDLVGWASSPAHGGDPTHRP